LDLHPFYGNYYVAIILAERKKQVLDAFSEKDDEWIWNNYCQVTSEWFDGHAQLEANKDRLLNLNIPVNIFHGVYDQNVPLQGVYDIYDSYRAKGKTNLKAFIFDQHDHDLNYILYPMKNEISDGLTRIFDECAKVK
jgi:esterase/lipase